MTRLQMILGSAFSLIALSGMVGYAAADLKTGQHTRAHIHAEMDTNTDGIITQDEATAFKAARAARLDVNSDGILSAEEFKEAWAQKRHTRLLKRLDADNNGEITVAEFMAHDRLFQKHDANNDGQISADEWPSYRGKPAPVE